MWRTRKWSCIFLLILGINMVSGQKKTTVFHLIGIWGETGGKAGQFRNPESIDVSPGGYVYVCDTGNNRVQKLDTAGTVLEMVGAFGWEKETFDQPLAVDARNGLDVFVTDHNNQRIERYDRDLNFISSFRSEESWTEQYQFAFPVDAALSSQGELFCLDGENNRILKLDVMGKPQLSFGDYDAGEGRLQDPCRMTISTGGKIFITDQGAGRIIAYDVHGNYLAAIGEEVFSRPAGITWQEPGILYIIDMDLKSLVVMDESGRQLSQMTMPAVEGPYEPVDVSVWKGRIYILDRASNRILLYKMKTFEGPGYR